MRESSTASRAPTPAKARAPVGGSSTLGPAVPDSSSHEDDEDDDELHTTASTAHVSHAGSPRAIIRHTNVRLSLCVYVCVLT